MATKQTTLDDVVRQENMMNKLGVIYEFRNMVNGKRYIGSAINGQKRKREHLSLLRRDKHHSGYLQNSFNKYGESLFVFEVIEDAIPIDNLIKREQYWIDKLLPEYNISKVAGSSLGIKRSDATRAKVRAANIGRKHSEETRIRMGKSRIGRIVTSETRAKLSKALTGRRPSDETLVRLKTARLGCRHTDESRTKISKALIGKVVSEETRIKLRSYRATEETRIKLGIIHSRPVSQLDKNTGEVIRNWPSATKAARECRCSQSNISKVCLGERMTAGGYKWAFAR